MGLVDLWENSRNQVEDKHIKQIIAFAGDGKLLDGRAASIEFRDFLATIPSRLLQSYTDQCLSDRFDDSGFALQDIVNEVGSRLGFKATNGRYRGSSKKLGYDGLWSFPSGHHMIVEVKTTDAYRIDLDTIAGYRKALIQNEEITEDSSSILIVVGRKDTGDLEAQIRGSRHAWDIRLISVDALLRLMLVKEEVDDPKIIQRIHDILIPREFTRLDEIVEIVFSATEDVKSESTETKLVEDLEEDETSKEPKFTPVAFHQACIDVLEKHFGRSLVKRTRSTYSTSDNALALTCSISKEYERSGGNWYWFAFHPHQKEFLENTEKAYVTFGCGSPQLIACIPSNDLFQWLDQLNTTEKNDRFYWHIHISQHENDIVLHRKRGFGNIDLSNYLIQESKPREKN